MLRIVVCNCSPKESEALARALVEERLAACVNILPGVRSIYRWEGAVCDEVEDTLLIKTSAAHYEAMKTHLQALHSYSVPEIIALDAVDVLDAYARWAHEQIG